MNGTLPSCQGKSGNRLEISKKYSKQRHTIALLKSQGSTLFNPLLNNCCHNNLKITSIKISLFILFYTTMTEYDNEVEPRDGWENHYFFLCLNFTRERARLFYSSPNKSSWATLFTQKQRRVNMHWSFLSNFQILPT